MIAEKGRIVFKFSAVAAIKKKIEDQEIFADVNQHLKTDRSKKGEIFIEIEKIHVHLHLSFLSRVVIHKETIW